MHPRGARGRGWGWVLLRSGCAKAAAFSAERQSRRAPAAPTRRAFEGTREAVRTSVQQPAQGNAGARAAPLGQPLSNHHGQRRVLGREKTVEPRSKR